MNTHENARLTPKGREDMVRAVVDQRAQQGRSRPPVQHHAQDRRQVGRALQGRRRRWFARPILKTSFIAKPNPARHSRCGREFAPPAPHPGAHRGRARHLQGHRLAHSQAPRPQPALQPRAAGAKPALRAREARRDHPSRHQEARPLQQHRPPHHRRSQRPEQQRKAPAGSSPTSPSTIIPASPAPTSSPTRRRKAPSPSSAPPSPTSKASASRVDRVMTDNGSCYHSKAFARACKQLGIKHITTKPYTPQTNGKAERFIQTALTRMGLRHSLRALRAATRDALPPGCIATIGTGPMLASHKQATHQPPRPDREQPLEASQLANSL